MRKLLINAALIVSATLSAPAMAGFTCADQINSIGGLNDKAKQTMIVECEKNKLHEVSVPAPTTAEELDKWSDISLKFAKAIGVAAKEFGVAVNDFLETDAGKLTAVFIGWQVLGDDITYAGLSVLVLIFVLGTTNKLRKTMRLNGYEEREKTFMGKVIGKTKQPIYRTWDGLSGETATMIVLSHAAELVLFIVILANF